MGVTNDPVVKMRHPLHIRKRHHGTLNTDEEIHDGAGENKFGADVGMNLSELSFGRVPDVNQKRHDGDDHGHAVHNGDDFEPGGRRHLQQMVSSDMGINNQQRPEPEQREGMAV